MLYITEQKRISYLLLYIKRKKHIFFNVEIQKKKFFFKTKNYCNINNNDHNINNLSNYSKTLNLPKTDLPMKPNSINFSETEKKNEELYFWQVNK